MGFACRTNGFPGSADRNRGGSDEKNVPFLFQVRNMFFCAVGQVYTLRTCNMFCGIACPSPTRSSMRSRSTKGYINVRKCGSFRRADCCSVCWSSPRDNQFHGAPTFGRLASAVIYRGANWRHQSAISNCRCFGSRRRRKLGRTTYALQHEGKSRWLTAYPQALRVTQHQHLLVLWGRLVTLGRHPLLLSRQRPERVEIQPTSNQMLGGGA